MVLVRLLYTFRFQFYFPVIDQSITYISQQRETVPHPLIIFINKHSNQPTSTSFPWTTTPTVHFLTQTTAHSRSIPGRRILRVHAVAEVRGNLWWRRDALRRQLRADVRIAGNEPRRHSGKRKRARVMHDVPLPDVRILLETVLGCLSFFDCLLIDWLVLGYC